MNTNKKTLWLLGAAFLVVFVASLLSGSLLDQATGSGTILLRAKSGPLP